jgi:MiaB-like tRNA modifying enzyme
MRVYFEPYGCTLNYGEARMMEALVVSNKHSIVDDAKNADLLVLVTCTVIESTERRMFKRIHELLATSKPLVVAGCMATVQKNEISALSPDIHILPPGRLVDIVELCKKAKKGTLQPSSGSSVPAGGRLAPRSVDAIVPIAQGCLGECTYCITRFARGELRSYPLNKITKSVSGFLSEGYREIRLTAQDTAAYGQDSGSSLPALVEKVSSIDGDFRVRIGMMNPSGLKKVMEKLIECYRSPKVFKFLHVPVQSGSDEILRKMKRDYSADEFCRLVGMFRSEFPDLTISTDIIIGFPGETDKHFGESYKLIEELKPEIVNITRYSPRPGTKAAKMDEQVPGGISKDRSRKLVKLRFEVSLKINGRFVGTKQRILITEVGKRDTLIGRTDAYRPVVIKEKAPLGSFVDVEITGAQSVYLEGKLQ